ncbi:Remorin family protein [Euphorbia peplus]|nr:Remorin family protein [Euphorbia peplus]
MRSIEDKGCYNHGPIQEISSSNGISFEFHKGNNVTRNSHPRTGLGKPTPSKWDDAQKWLVGLSRGGGDKNSNSQPRNSNADDRRLIAPVPAAEQEYSSGEDDVRGGEERIGIPASMETKKVDCDASSVWRINKPVMNSTPSAIRSICVRDMGTEMTPIASQEPSRTATPIRAGTPVARSPISSGSSTPMRCQHGLQCGEQGENRGDVGFAVKGRHGEELCSKIAENKGLDEAANPNPLETRAMAWDEAERAKYMARYKREEVKIQAWENHEKRRAEMEMKKLEVKAERIKARAQEKLASKIASTKRIAEEKRANAEAKLNEKAVQTAERADYIRRTGHLPSSFSFKLPSICW